MARGIAALTRALEVVSLGALHRVNRQTRHASSSQPRPGPLGVRVTLLKPVSRLDLSLAIQRLLLKRAVVRTHQ